MLRLYVLSNKKKMIPFPWHDISHYNIPGMTYAITISLALMTLFMPGILKWHNSCQEYCN
jgi:hypothetical protein